MYRVLITDPISQRAIELLERQEDIKLTNLPDISFEELLNIVPDFDCIITRSRTPVNRELLERASSLRVVGRAGVGVDNVDIEFATLKGVLVVNTPGANTIGATELTIAHMLNVLRQTHRAHQSLIEGKWERKYLMGNELYGKTLGIIGLGNIGSQVAIRAKAFGMDVYTYDPYIPDEKAERLGVVRLSSLEEMLKIVDILTIHAPLTHETRNMITEREFNLMKSGAILINCARGGIVNDEDLIKALESKKLAGVGLDVFSIEPPKQEFIERIKKFENVSLSPHIGANTYESQENVGIVVVQQVLKALRGQTPEYLVNAPFPDLSALSLAKPHIDLARRMGKFFHQWAKQNLKELEIEVRGEFINYAEALASSVLSGLLEDMVEFPINIINAGYVAKDMGINLNLRKEESSGDYRGLIKLRSKTSNKIIVGTVLEGHLLRIVQIDNYRVDLEPAGTLLCFENRDVPGVIGSVGTILGKAGINIAGFRLGRQKPGGIALGILTLDEPAPDSVLRELEKLPNLIEITQVSL
ncbi:MAG: phosphoglycerate dehydrogenase [Aquificaceae bacterium]